MQNIKKGFTLIELLVVISIIGVISTIVLVSFSGTREKARLARAQQLSASIRHSLGAYSIGEWGFEEQAGATVYDLSGNGNNGTIHDNEGADWVEGIIPGTTALRLDGVDDYVEIPASSSLRIRKNFVWELWFKADQIDAVPRGLMDQDENWNFLWLFNGKIWFSLADATPAPISTLPAGRIESNADIEADKWYHVAALYDGVKMYLYIDGVLDSESATTGEDSGPSVGTCAMRIGGMGALPFDGVIDQIAIYEGSF